MGQQRWLEEHRRQSHIISIGDRWPDTLATHPPPSLKIACVQIKASTGCVRGPLDTVPLCKRNGTSRRGRPWRLFACGQIYAKEWPLGEGRPAEGLAPRYELGRLFAAISLGLRRALRLKLRIADGFGQHLAKLSLRLRRLSRKGFLPLGHGQYVGMTEAKLNPACGYERGRQLRRPSHAHVIGVAIALAGHHHPSTAAQVRSSAR
jgi:hypothetical protein